VPPVATRSRERPHRRHERAFPRLGGRAAAAGRTGPGRGPAGERAVRPEAGISAAWAAAGGPGAPVPPPARLLWRRGCRTGNRGRPGPSCLLGPDLACAYRPPDAPAAVCRNAVDTVILRLAAAGTALASLTPGSGTTTWASGGHISARVPRAGSPAGHNGVTHAEPDDGSCAARRDRTGSQRRVRRSNRAGLRHLLLRPASAAAMPPRPSGGDAARFTYPPVLTGWASPGLRTWGWMRSGGVMGWLLGRFRP